jgi:hypothetical protein
MWPGWNGSALVCLPELGDAEVNRRIRAAASANYQGAHLSWALTTEMRPAGVSWTPVTAVMS